MLTVISVKELEEVLKGAKLANSAGIDFMGEGTVEFLSDEFKKAHNEEPAAVLYLKELEGEEVTVDNISHVQENLETVLQNMPEYDEDQVVVFIVAPEKKLVFKSYHLNELDTLNLQDEEERNYAIDSLKDSVGEDIIVYALTTPVAAQDIKTVIYPSALQGQLKELEELGSKEGIQFLSTPLFE